MIYQFTIPGTLPGLNEYIDAERSNRYKAAAMKKNAEELIKLCAIQQLRGVQFAAPVTMHYTWYEPNRRRDMDNISSFGRKVIQDALVKAGVLRDDGWKYIDGFEDHFEVDSADPRVEIFINESEEKS